MAVLTYRSDVFKGSVKSPIAETAIQPTNVPGTLNFGQIELTVLRIQMQRLLSWQWGEYKREPKLDREDQCLTIEIFCACMHVLRCE